VAVLFLASVCGCGRQEAAAPLFVYCPPGVQPYAAGLVGKLSQGPGAPATLAPVRDEDLLAALAGLKAGDLVVCTEGTLPEALAAAGLARRRYAAGALRLAVLSRKPASLEDLCGPGVRLGSGTPKGPLGMQVRRALPPPIHDQVTANVVCRSEVSSELLRLLDQGALDAAFVWGPLQPTAARHEVDLDTTATELCCPLIVVELTCSRQPTAVLEHVRTVWSSVATAAPGPAAGAKTKPASREQP
jgi:hypothetical protein